MNIPSPNFEPDYPPAYEPDLPMPFRYLGYSGNLFYFYSYSAEAVIDISRSAITNAGSLLQLAPLTWWKSNGMTSEAGNIKTTPVANMLIEQSYRIGLFDHGFCRGRGAWDDNGTAVLHVGDKLMVGGKVTELHNHKSKYLYEKRLSMNVDYAEKLTSKEAYKLLEICRLVRWEEKISGELLAGWIVIAPICGALTYRPHIYVLGPATSGKSWVMEEIIRAILSKTAFVTTSKSTAAGIRQALKSDALPVIFDEAEAEEIQDRVRLQEIFDLARSAFNGEAGPIHKGTADQSGKAFLLRSVFAFASINMSMQRHADETRTSILKLKQPSKDAKYEAENFGKLQRLAAETINAKWRGGLLARTVSLIPTIKANAETFAQVAAIHFGSRRQGDQLGGILAGLYSLHSPDLIEPEAAKKFLEEREWPQQKETTDDSSHGKLWRFLQESEIKVDTEHGMKNRTILDLINISADGLWTDGISKTMADTELKRKGFCVEEGYVWVSNTNSWIKERLRHSEWTGRWSHTLKCIIGSIVSPTTRRFVTSDRCVGIPLETEYQHQLGD
jgi:putative DNA primase/helicase